MNTKWRPVVLLYHRIADEDDHFRLCVPVASFEAQMRFLRDECDPMPLEAFADGLVEERLPDRAVAVTFDDGYLDNLTVAAPILAAAGVPATFFITTAGIDDGREYWWDQLIRLLLREPALPSIIDLPTDPPRRVSIRSWSDRVDAIGAVHQAMRRTSAEVRDAAIEALASQIPSSVAPGPRPVTAAEARMLAGIDGCTIGAHTVRHLSLPSQPVEVQRREMAECRTTLEAVTGGPVRALAYPFGEASAETVDVAERLGFATGVIVGPTAQAADAARRRRLMLPRADVASVGPEFASALSTLAGTGL